MDEFEMFLFDSDVALALMRGLSYEEAVEEAKQIRRDEREWQRLTKPAPDAWDSAPLKPLSTPEVDSDLGKVPTPTKRR